MGKCPFSEIWRKDTYPQATRLRKTNKVPHVTYTRFSETKEVPHVNPRLRRTMITNLKWSNFQGSMTTAQDPSMTQGSTRTAQDPQVTQGSITDKNQWVVTGSVVSGTTNTQHHPYIIFFLKCRCTCETIVCSPHPTPMYLKSVCVLCVHMHVSMCLWLCASSVIVILPHNVEW